MFLGIDIGTSAVKAVIINASGEPVATAATSLPISRPKSNWSEQDPQDWWNSVNKSVLKLPYKARQAVQAIGLSGQMHGATLIGADDQVLRPAILWNDGRSIKECAALQKTEPDFLTHGANLVMPGFTAPKLEWVRRNEPDIFAKISKVLLPKDYVRLCMTGDYATDMSDAAGTLWMDVAQRKWHVPLLEACGLSSSHMPQLYEGPEITGQLHASIAKDWGMTSVPVIAGGSDNAAGALGAGAIEDGDTILSLGTSGVIFTTAETFCSNPASAVHAFCHALPERWHLMSVMLSAASCLDWACRITNIQNAAELISLAETGYSPDSEVMFLPYLSGERTPHNNVNARGALAGLTHETGPADIANAVLEGVAFGLAEGFEALLSAGARVNALSVIGGGARSRHWGRILATVLKRPLYYRQEAMMGPALGAARLAQFSLRGARSMSNIFSSPAIRFVVDPCSAYANKLSLKQARFKALYQHLKPTFEGR